MQKRSKTPFGICQGHMAGFRNLRQKMILRARCKLTGSKEASAPLPPPTPPVDTAYISSNVPQLISNLLEGDPERINYI